MIKLNIKRFGSTNKTTNYELSQFVSSDKPSWLNDINSDMSKIDTAIHTAKTTADGASTAAGNAQTAAEGAQTTANTAITNAATADGKATTANNNIGTLANLTTAEKTTVVGAINEVDGDIGNISSLTTDVKTDIVSAINSIETKIEELDNYSTTETDTGKKINNEEIYRIFIVYNNSGHNSDVDIPTPTAIKDLVEISVKGYNGSAEIKPLPSTTVDYVHGNTVHDVTYRNNLSSYRPNTINILDGSRFDKFEVILEYTKN